MALTVIPPIASNQVQLRYTLTSSGTLTIPGVSTINPVTATVVCIGAGAGGSCGNSAKLHTNELGTGFGTAGRGGAGGMGGSVTIAQMLITAPIDYTIGAGGTGSTSTDNTVVAFGNGGGDTNFGGQVIAAGGKGFPDNIQSLVNQDSGVNINFMFSGIMRTITNTTNPAAGRFGARNLRPDGTFMSGMAANNGPTFSVVNPFIAGSHGGGFTPVAWNNTTGGAVGTGKAGEAGGTAGGGTAGITAMSGWANNNGGASSSTTAYGLQVANQFYGGGGGGGASGQSNGAGALTGGAGGTATLWGGAGGTGGTGGNTSGAGTAAGSAGTAASGYGAGGGGGGGMATGNTTATAAITLLGGAGASGSQGVIYIFY